MGRENTIIAIFSDSLFAAINLTAADIRQIATFVICLVIATSVHEFAHAFTANRLGDPTPKQEDRLTLNPLSHIDPIGTLVLPVFAGLFNAPLLGWGRPVSTQPRYYTRKITMRGGMALVSFAGPFSNFLQAIVTLVLWKVLHISDVVHPGDGLWDILFIFYRLNIVLMAFNLLPLHPLDGGKILAWLLPARFQHIDDFLLRYGGFILLILIFALPGFLDVLFRPVFLVSNWGMSLFGL